MASVGRLDRYKDVIQIDNIVKRSQGAYTHDSVWFLNILFVNNLLLTHFEQDSYLARYESIQNQMREANKPKR